MSGKYLIVSDEDSVWTAYDKLKKTLNKAASKSLPKKPLVSTESSYLTEQWLSAQKRYQNYSNCENYNTWTDIVDLVDTSLVNDKKINKIKQMGVVADAASKTNDTKRLFNIA